MTETTNNHWLKWARKIQALSQSGLAYADDEFNRERYQKLGEIAAEIIDAHTTLCKEYVLNNFRLQPGYATPKIDIRGVVFQDNKLLLVQEQSDEKWSLPGGWADVGDSAAEMVIREVKEETGFEVFPTKLIGIFDNNKDRFPIEFYHSYKIIFWCEMQGGKKQPCHEILAVDFFKLTDLPPLSVNRTDEKHLHEIIEHINNPNRLAYFD